MLEQLPFIELMDNGFSERYKPGGKAFYSTAENRHVQMTCWTYRYQSEQKDENGERIPTISREMCLVMNELARIISGVNDDWWKSERGMAGTTQVEQSWTVLNIQSLISKNKLYD